MNTREEEIFYFKKVFEKAWLYGGYVYLRVDGFGPYQLSNLDELEEYINDHPNAILSIEYSINLGGVFLDDLAKNF